MKSQLWFRPVGVAGLLAASIFIPQMQGARTAVPGTVNYIEGSVSINGKSLNTGQAGDATLQADQILSVGHGKAEVLLSPGVFMRVGTNSEIRMVSPELVDPKVEVVHGEAMIEVDQKLKQASLNVLERGSDTSVLKEGLYKFDADEGKVAVVDGKASVNDNGQSKEIGKGKEIVLNGGPLKAESFDRKAEDDLYRWSEVRSGYLAQANEASARTVYVNGGMGWGSGWYWNPYFSTFAWLPGDGYFWSPFGYPFFSPRFVGYAPVIRSGGYISRGGFVASQRVASRGVVAPGMAFRSAPAVRSMGASSMGASSMGARTGGRR
jgi:hypothetical protein